MSLDHPTSARVLDINGYVTVDNNPISRSGVFPYLGKSISKECDPDRIYNVYRPDEELEDPEAIESFKMLPFIDDHTMLGPEDKGLIPAEMKGVQGITGESVQFKNGILFAKLRIFSQTLKDIIESGKSSLSLGYRCVFEKNSGVYNGIMYDYIQRKLRGNHLALVDQARCDVAVLDNNIVFDHFDLALDTGELKKMADKENSAKGDQEAKDKAIKDAAEKSEKDAEGKAPEKDGGEEKKEMTLSDAHAFMKDMMPKISKINELLKKHGGGEDDEESTEATDPATDDADFKPTTTTAKTGTGNGVQDAEEKEKMDKEAKDAEEKEKGAMDAAIKTLTGKIDTLQKDGFKAIMKEAASRDQLANQLSQFVGTFDHSEMTQNEVAAYGVEKLGIKCGKGQELTVLAGYLHDRKPSTVGFSMDSAASTGGKKGKYAEAKLKRQA